MRAEGREEALFRRREIGRKNKEEHKWLEQDIGRKGRMVERKIFVVAGIPEDDL